MIIIQYYCTAWWLPYIVQYPQLPTGLALAFMHVSILFSEGRLITLKYAVYSPNAYALYFYILPSPIPNILTCTTFLCPCIQRIEWKCNIADIFALTILDKITVL